MVERLQEVFVGNSVRKRRRKVGEQGKGEERDRRVGGSCKGYHKNALYRNKEVRNSVAN